jgi:hypothetical protein
VIPATGRLVSLPGNEHGDVEDRLTREEWLSRQD